MQDLLMGCLPTDYLVSWCLRGVGMLQTPDSVEMILLVAAVPGSCVPIQSCC